MRLRELCYYDYSYSTSEIILISYVDVRFYSAFTNAHYLDTSPCHLIMSLLYIVQSEHLLPICTMHAEYPFQLRPRRLSKECEVVGS
jgi:hypothetical protein